MPTRATALLCAALTLVLAACGDDDGPTGPGADPDVGRISFDYSGQRSGRFAAEGRMPDDTASTLYGSWAGAIRSGGDIVVVGSRARTAPRVDLVFLVVEDVDGAGTYAIDPFGEGPALALVLFDAHADSANIDDVEGETPTYVLTSGSVTITSLDGARVRGSFSGDAVALVGSERLFIRQGSFDLPVREEDFARMAAAAPAFREAVR